MARNFWWAVMVVSGLLVFASTELFAQAVIRPALDAGLSRLPTTITPASATPGGQVVGRPYLPQTTPIPEPTIGASTFADSPATTVLPGNTTSPETGEKDSMPLPEPDRPVGIEIPFMNLLNPRGRASGDSPKYPLARMTGVVQLDAIYPRQSTLNRQTVGLAEDGLDFRRARLAATGNLSEDISYILEFDFAASQARFVDTWVQFSKVPFAGNVRIGRFRQPFGMTELTGGRDLPFLERALPSVLSPFRQTGLMVFDTALEERATYAVSGYRYNSDPFGNVYSSFGGYGMAARFTGLPMYIDDSNLIHVGADFSVNQPGGPIPMRITNTPEVFAGYVTGSALTPTAVSFPQFVDTGFLNVQQATLFNLEAAYIRGNFAIQGEVRWDTIDQSDAKTVTLPGYYAHVRYVLTGENITYSKQNAVMSRVKPANPVSEGGIGAWEVAARWSYIDLNGTNGRLLKGEPAPGRSLNDFTLELSWYMIHNVRFQFNYIYAMLADEKLGSSNASIWAARCQFDF